MLKEDIKDLPTNAKRERCLSASITGSHVKPGHRQLFAKKQLNLEDDKRDTFGEIPEDFHIVPANLVEIGFFGLTNAASHYVIFVA